MSTFVQNCKVQRAEGHKSYKFEEELQEILMYFSSKQG